MSVALPGRRRSPWTVVVALGITQITAWGSIYYVFALLLTHLERDLAIGKETAVGAFSLALLISGVLAPAIGRRIDQRGGRGIMVAGSVLGGIGLMLAGQVQAVWQLYLVWALLGVAMAATLYEPAFAVLTRLFEDRYRQAITVLTLFGGFASTVFWPLAQWLISVHGWREALLILGLLNLVGCSLIHATLLPRADEGHALTPGRPAQPKAGQDLSTVLKQRAFYLLCAAFTANALVFSAMAVHMLPMLQEKGLSPLQAAWIGAMVGPMQVAGRLVEMLFGRRFKALQVGLVAMSMLPLSLLVFAVLGQAALPYLVFAFLYGAGNGVTTIVRGAIPAEVFGRAHYGAVNGAMAAPVLVAKASGPLVAAAIWTAVGHYESLALVLAGAAALSILLMALLLSQQRAAAPAA